MREESNEGETTIRVQRALPAHQASTGLQLASPLGPQVPAGSPTKLLGSRWFACGAEECTTRSNPPLESRCLGSTGLGLNSRLELEKRRLNKLDEACCSLSIDLSPLQDASRMRAECNEKTLKVQKDGQERCEHALSCAGRGLWCQHVQCFISYMSSARACP